MTNLNYYMVDGASAQAQAVLAFLKDFHIEDSWDSETKRYDAEVSVGRWENCREQGYVLSLTNKRSKQLNIAFFEHRNNDSICAMKWEKSYMNTPTIADLEKTDNFSYPQGYFSVPYGDILNMVDYIKGELTLHWKK